ncbi:MAG TPA: DNA-processing protein DprA [Capsulimonadaceae bacterium]|jgi:DNA processing protein
MTDELYILTLLSLPGIGKKSASIIFGMLSEPPSTLATLIDVIREAKRLHPRISVPSAEQAETAQNRATNIVDDAANSDIRIICQSHSNFPERLKTISDPPLILYAKGNLDCLLALDAVAIIGTREPSEYGYRVGEKLGAAFASMGFVVVSGLATGCDTRGHVGCLRAGGRTVAVLAHGLKTIYPSENRNLASEIVEKSGCLVSEYAPNEKAQRSYFVERDRLQSALSAGVVVIETDVKGGTMHTVGFCLEQGKPLACLVHPPKYADHPKVNGNKYLIARGDAIGLATPGDVRDFAMGMRGKNMPREDATPVDQPSPEKYFTDLFSLPPIPLANDKVDQTEHAATGDKEQAVETDTAAIDQLSTKEELQSPPKRKRHSSRNPTASIVQLPLNGLEEV